MRVKFESHLSVPSLVASGAVAACLVAGCAGSPDSSQTGSTTRPSPAPNSYPPTLRLSDGLWFDGDRFESKTFYSVGGVLTEVRPARVDSVLDLGGGYVVPPFGEGHNHNVSRPARDEELARYVEAGVFYVMIQNNLIGEPVPADAASSTEPDLDVAYANGGFTPSGGHVVELNQRLVDWGVIQGLTKEELDGRGYVVVDTEGDLDRKWGAVLAARPDVIKVYLGASEEYSERKGSPAFFGKRGLDPRLLRSIVQRAHRVGLRVSAHIETATDFHHALEAGVDIIAHLPGWRVGQAAGFKEFRMDRWLVTETDARLAARSQTVIMTTVLAGEAAKDPAHEQHDVVRRIAARNLDRLKSSGARIALGSDFYGGTAVTEALLLGRQDLVEPLESLGVFDNAELLRLLCEVTPQAIFPGRKIGRLDEGYEASFLVLQGDPLEDFANVERITLRVKNGRVFGS